MERPMASSDRRFEQVVVLRMENASSKGRPRMWQQEGEGLQEECSSREEAGIQV